MIQLLYFASFRETLGLDQEKMDFEADQTIADLIEVLKSRGETWQAIFNTNIPVLCARNQDMVDFNETIQDGDEIAFFPPVTGG